MAGTGVGKFSSTAGSNTANMTVNFAENMAPSNVNNAARELMGHIRDMYEQIGDGYFEFGDGDGTYTVARSDADTITITSSSDISSVYFAGRKIRITDGGANVVEGTIASSSHSSTTQTVNLTGISLASGTPTKVELGIDTAAFGGRVILDDDGDTYIEAPTDDTIDIYVAGAKDFVITANTFTAESGSTIAAQALTATSITSTGNIIIPDAGNIGSASDTDSIAIASDGVVTFSQAPVFPDGSIAVADLDIDGATDIGEAIVDADLFIIDNGAGGTNRKVAASRLKTYAGGSLAGIDDQSSSNDDQVTITDTAVVINEDSDDLDFRVESNGNANMLFVSGGNDVVGIGAEGDLGIGLHIKESDSGSSSVDAHANQLVIEHGTSGEGCGISFLAATDGFVRLAFGDSGDDNIGQILYNNTGDILQFFAGANHVMKLTSSTVIVNEDSDDVDFRIESNNYVNMLYLDGGTDRIGIGNNSSAPSHTVDVRDAQNDVIFSVRNTLTSGNIFGQLINFGYAPDDNSNHFFYCADTVANRFFIYSDGDVKNHDNSYGSISDERIKQDIRDSNSQWDDIKAVKVRNYKKKDDVRQYGDKAWEQIGVIAQELEDAGMDKLIKESDPTPADILSDASFGTLWTKDDSETQDAVLYTADSQEVIDGDKNVGDIKTPSTKQIGDVKEVKQKVKGVSYSVLYMKAIKALQEAQTRIETLETKVAALEG
jgi:hypothetical protein